jgi:hypothetical protein
VPLGLFGRSEGLGVTSLVEVGKGYVIEGVRVSWILAESIAPQGESIAPDPDSRGRQIHAGTYEKRDKGDSDPCRQARSKTYGDITVGQEGTESKKEPESGKIEVAIGDDGARRHDSRSRHPGNGDKKEAQRNWAAAPKLGPSGNEERV